MEWRASHILVKDSSLANKIIKDLKEGKKFADLAKEFSTCPSKSKGGDLGWFGPGQMVKEFEESVKKQSSGSISRVVRTKFGLHIIKKTGQR
ncbi:MAG: peptidylprolyl isomerase [Candidatus Aminicenantes bacterium]|nr:peptidylprolyl isomerase [Candidatus Aminicenantes bacterium]